MNLYKLCLMRGQDNLYHNEIHINKSILKIRKVMRSYKDYGTSNIFWSEPFLNYTMILMALFGLIIPTFYLTLAGFHQKIIELSTIYEWQNDVPLLALDFHTHIVESQPTNPNRWAIPAKWQACFCNLLTIFRNNVSAQKKKRTYSPLSSSSAKKDLNNNSVSYISYNKGIYTYANCHQKYIYNIFGGKDHGSKTYKKANWRGFQGIVA